MLKTPVIFLIFKRPNETARVFEQIRKAQPPKLFIVADGPRNDGEKKLTDAVRSVVEKIDWPCVVEQNYSEKNLGCRERVASGLDWAFGRLTNPTDGAIILEDDCLPDQTFFAYCEEMLEKYKTDENKRVKKFAERMVGSFLDSAKRERQRADEEKQLRKIEFEG